MSKNPQTAKSKAKAAPRPAPDDSQTGPDSQKPDDAKHQHSAAKAGPRSTKIDGVVALLRRPEGARIDEIMALTGWQAHSVRGAMSGAIKKGLGLTITSAKVDGVRAYRIPEASA